MNCYRYNEASVICRHYPVKHYIKEAKKLKHKADAEVSLCFGLLIYLK